MGTIGTVLVRRSRRRSTWPKPLLVRGWFDVGRGCPFEQQRRNNCRSHYVYRYDEIARRWNQRGQVLDGQPLDRLGFAVELSSDGSILAASATESYLNGVNSGHLCICQYRQDATGLWEQLGQGIAGEEAHGLSGRALALSSNGLVVAGGTIFNDEAGFGAGHV